MARLKKESTPVNVKMENSIYNMLEEFCQLTGLSKTVVVEKAVEQYVSKNIQIYKTDNSQTGE